MDQRKTVTSLLAAGALIAGALAADAPAQSFGEPIAIEDPSGHALDHLHTALRRAAAGQGRARMMFWGASHTAEDQFTGFLRQSWQRRFGDAGPGFVLPARPFALYDHREVAIAETGAWRVVRVRGRRRPPDRYGPAGFAIEAAHRAEAFVAPREPVDRARVFFLEQAGGGRFEMQVGEGRPEVVRTRGDGVASRSIEPEGGVSRIAFRACGDGPVRLFGVSLERDAPGVIIDAMGVPGARLRDRLPWEDRAMRRQLAELEPDLIVLAYGTNEAGFTGRPLRRYRAEVDEAVRRARAAAPGASCLLIGPSDRPRREADGTFSDRPRTAQVIAIQRAAARRHGCGYFDLVAFQGGTLSMPRWVGAGLALDDHVHFTEEGHEILARVLSRALLRGLD